MKRTHRQRLVSCLCGIAIVLIAGFGGGILASAQVSPQYEEECDIVFFEALGEILTEESITEETIEIKKEPIYDLTHEQLGFIYLMDLGEHNGYALIINTDGIFEITEMYMNAENPYKGYSGQKIYVTLMLYLIYEDGNYTEVGTGVTLDNEAIELLTEKAFSSSSDSFSNEQETIYYTNRIPNTFELAKRHPAYVVSGLDNGCAPTSAGSILGFYDRYYENLIPNFTPGSAMGNFYLYKEAPAEPEAVIWTLSSYMGTNTTAPGTTIDGFKYGLTRYVNEKGRNISYSSCMQGNNFNFNAAKQRLNEGMPIALFLDTFTVAQLTNSSGSEIISYFVVNACHAMAGFGYTEITYTLTNGQIRSDNYIQVATGLPSNTKGYFNINYKTQIDDVYAINIY